MKLLIAILLFASCGGEEPMVAQSCPTNEINIGGIKRTEAHTCIQRDENWFDVEFEYSPTTTTTWFYYLLNISLKTNLPQNVLLPAEQVIKDEIRLRTIDALNETALIGYYKAKISGTIFTNELTKLCVKIEIGVAGSSRPAIIDISTEVLCKSNYKNSIQENL